jgi:hypothetical protein
MNKKIRLIGLSIVLTLLMALVVIGSALAASSDTGGTQPAGSGCGTMVTVFKDAESPTDACPMDYGDLPIGGGEGIPNYGMTTFAQDGARHVPGDLMLGISIDVESDGQPDSLAKGDDNHGIDDEDGVVPVQVNADPGYWTKGKGLVNVTATGPEGGGGCLMGWMDFWDSQSNSLGMDGDFDDFDPSGAWSETIINNQWVEAGPAGVTTQVSFNLPEDVSGYPLYARFRLVPDADGDKSCKDQAPACYEGLKINGEVEDYRWGWKSTAVTLQSINASTAPDGSTDPLILGLSALGIIALGLFWKVRRQV